MKKRIKELAKDMYCVQLVDEALRPKQSTSETHIEKALIRLAKEVYEDAKIAIAMMQPNDYGFPSKVILRANACRVIQDKAKELE